MNTWASTSTRDQNWTEIGSAGPRQRVNRRGVPAAKPGQGRTGRKALRCDPRAWAERLTERLRAK